jgi:hypothetical protein
MATLNAVNLAFLRTVASTDREALKAVSGLSDEDCDTIKNMSLHDIYNIARTPVLLCKPTFQNNDILRKLLNETKTDDDTMGATGITELLRSLGSKGK